MITKIRGAAIAATLIVLFSLSSSGAATADKQLSAVRGDVTFRATEQSPPGGTQLYCVECAPGDITMTTSFDAYSIVSGQTLNIRTVGGKAFDADVISNARINNPAIDQFLHGYSPFGEPMEKGTDFTGSGSGTSR